MNLQVIKSTQGKPEYVLLPIAVYARLQQQIEKALIQTKEEYEPFDVADYIDNPIALARVKKHLTQQELANLMGVTQAYISKIESQTNVSYKILNKVFRILDKIKEK